MGFAGGNRGGAVSAVNSGGQSSSANAGSNRGRRAPIWIMGEDKLVRPVVVKLGLTDGVQTEIVEGNLKEGDKIILSTEVNANRSTSSTTRAPGFGPPMGRGR